MTKHPALALIACLALLGGCSAPTAAQPQTVVTVTAQPSELATPTPTPSVKNQTPTLTKDDFAVTLKIRGKKCFGSAGCNVTFKASVTYLGYFEVEDLPTYIDITYKIKGGDEAYTSTIEMEDGKYSPDSDTIGTRNARAKLTAVVTDVESY